MSRQQQNRPSQGLVRQSGQSLSHVHRATEQLEQLLTTPLATVSEMTRAFRELEKYANLIAPVTQVSDILPMHQITISAIYIDPKDDCYVDSSFCEKGKVGIGKKGLAKLMAGGGVQIIGIRQLDDGKHPYYRKVAMSIAIQDFNGRIRTVTMSKEVDFREHREGINPELYKPEWEITCSCGNKYTDKFKCPACNADKKAGRSRQTGNLVRLSDTAIARKRIHIGSLAETKALHRAVRQVFALKQKYTIAELEKPFVVPKLSPHLDPSDPDVKEALIRHALGGEALLYGPGASPFSEPTRGQLGLPISQGADIDPALMSNDVSGVTFDDEIDQEAQGNAALPAQPAQASPAAPVRIEAPAASADVIDPLLPMEDTSAETIHICGCPCGHQAVIKAETAKATFAQVGSERCGPCYPGRAFDYEAHKHLRTLELANRPDFTPDEAEDNRRRLIARAQ